MAKSRIKHGNRVYVSERQNCRDKNGKLKHRNTRYSGIEVIEMTTFDGKVNTHH